MAAWTRREFIRALTLGGLGALAAACAGRPAPGSPTPSGRRALTNENRPAIRPDWNVRYYRPYVPVDRDAWRLEIDGLVAAPQALALSDLTALPRIAQDTRMKCVECWSARAVFGGFVYATLAQIVRPQPEATWVTFDCADGYYESLAVDELDQPRLLFAYEMDGDLLLDEFGAPLRLVAPDRYGYKWPKAITALHFETRERRGYWPSVGPYTTDGVIQPGQDYPLDLNESRTISGGEITDY